jgi:hypothetical protein
MPETAVHKDDGLEPWKDNVWSTRQVSPTQSVPKTKAMQREPKPDFWQRIALPDASHHPRPRLLVDDVHQGAVRRGS